MAEHGNARGLGTAGAKEHDERPSIARGVTVEFTLAQQFLATLADPRASWTDAFEAFADQHGLTQDARRLVRLTILRLRTFGAAERFQPRPRRRRC